MGSKNVHGCTQITENGFSFNFSERFHEDGDKFLNHIAWVTGDESRVSSMNVETKEQSKQWMHTHSPNKPKKFRQTYARKLMATVWVLMVEFMQQGTTITSEVYCDTKKNPPCMATQNKRRGILTSGVEFHDNARPHTTACTWALLEHFNWELPDQSRSEQLPPKHYLKNWLAETTALQQ
jgi:hypothetical protein